MMLACAGEIADLVELELFPQAQRDCEGRSGTASANWSSAPIRRTISALQNTSFSFIYTLEREYRTGIEHADRLMVELIFYIYSKF